MPGGVPATAVTEAGDMPDEDLVRAECVPVRAVARRPGDPLAVRGLHQLAQHLRQRMTASRLVILL